MKKVLAAMIAGAFAVTAFAADAPKKDEKAAPAKAEAKKEDKKAAPAKAAEAKKDEKKADKK